MVCPKCGSENVTIQAVNEVKLKNSHHGCFWWLCIGWWWVPVKWLFLTVPALFAKIFIPNKQKAVNKTTQKAVCQNCGNMWEFKKSDWAVPAPQTVEPVTQEPSQFSIMVNDGIAKIKDYISSMIKNEVI